LGARPAVAGRERLGKLLNQSVLAQLMIAMCFFALALLFYLAQASQASVIQFNIADLQAQQQQLQINNANLHAQAAALQTAGRIDQAATTQLHMVKPDLGAAIWVRVQIPRVVPYRAQNADTLAAQRQSEPLAWLSNAFSAVKSSL
jgi:cell division protein FtsL